MNTENEIRVKLFRMCLILVGSSQTDFAESLGISKQHLSQVLFEKYASQGVNHSIDVFIQAHLGGIETLMLDYEHSLDQVEEL